MLPVGMPVGQRDNGEEMRDVAEFGERTRRHMEAAGVSLRELARRTHYDAGHLSKVLAGRKPAAPDLAARLDDALAAGGELVGLVHKGRSSEEEDRLAYVARHPRRVDKGAVDVLAGTLAQNRRLEDSIGSAPLLEPTVGQLRLIEDLVTEARGPVRSLLVDVAAQWAQFAGWLHANSGKHQAGNAYYDRALEWATEAGDVNMVSEALSLKGQQAWTLGHIGPVIGLSHAAQRDHSTFPGQRAISAAQEARGHAMAGDPDETDRKLDVAMNLATEATEKPGESPPWLYYHSPSFFDLQRGLAYRYLGRDDPERNATAVAELFAGLEGLDEDERHSEWAADYVCQLAIAHSQAREPDRACAAAKEVADVAWATRSTRLTGQLYDLQARLVTRWPDLPEVADLGEHLRAG